MQGKTLPYLTVLSLFIGICAPTLFSDGMFLDGITYSAISKNMAHGYGRFWEPHYTEGLAPLFYGHPPLAIGLQAICFKFFGDSIFVERLYSLLTFLITGSLIALIWKRVSGSFKFGWLPILLWILVSDVSWACSNNMLENTMMIFTTLSFLWVLKGEKKSLIWFALAGISLFLALLCKGLTSLYIWSAPLLMWVFLKKHSFSKMLIQSTVLVVSTIIPVLILILFSEDAQNFLIKYTYEQVFDGIANVQTVNSRFTIVWKFIEKIIPSLLLILGILIFAKRKKLHLKIGDKKKLVFVLIALTLAGILPIMISLKQRGFYILTVYPFFAIGAGIMLLPIVSQIKSLKLKWVKLLFVFSTTVAISVSIISWGEIGRDKNLIHDCKLIINTIGHRKLVNVCSDTRKRYNVIGYFSRYGGISLMNSKQSSEEYIILFKDNCLNEFEGEFEKVNIPTKDFHLYKKGK